MSQTVPVESLSSEDLRPGVGSDGITVCAKADRRSAVFLALLVPIVTGGAEGIERSRPELFGIAAMRLGVVTNGCFSDHVHLEAHSTQRLGC
jgi:hypothetical protein